MDVQMKTRTDEPALDYRGDDLGYASTKWSRFLYRDALRAGEEMPAPEKQVAGVGSFLRELYHRLHTGSDAPVDNPEPWVKQAHDAIGQCTDFESVRAQTQGDEVFSTITTQAVGKAVLESLPEPPDATDHVEDEASAVALDTEGAHDLAQQYRDRAAASRNAWAEWAKGIDPSKTRNAVRSGLVSAKADMDASETGSVLWGTQAGSPGQETTTRRRQIAKRVASDKRVRAIAKLAGRMVALAEGKRATTVHRPGAKVVGVTTGRDMRRVLPGELAALGTEVEDLFLLKWSAGTLLQWETNTEQKSARGPVVICVDQSGSMSCGTRAKIDGHDVTYHDWASALSLAIALQAAKDGRSAYLLPFDAVVRREVVAAPGAPMEPVTEAVLGWAAGGGTSWEVVLRRAGAIVDGTARDADVVMVTDDECGVSESFHAWWTDTRARLGITAFGLDVSGRCQALGAVSDQVWSGDVAGGDGNAIDLAMGAVVK